MPDRKPDEERQPLATPEDFALVFESHRSGQKVLQYLIERYGSTRTRSSGIDRILDTMEKKGSREVLDHIILQINKANGEQDHADQDITVSVDE